MSYSWLRTSPLRNSFSKPRSRDSPPKDADPTACYDSFRKHWQQSHEIICQSMPPKTFPSQDDVLGVVNHIDRMTTLLLLELRDFPLNCQGRLQLNVSPAQLQTHCSPCLEFLLSEKILDKLYEWSLHTGRYGNAVRLEQLKLYEMLVSHSNYLLTHESITKPLLRLLDECATEIMPHEVEKKLVILLNYLCVALVQNTELLEVFFRPTAKVKNRFIVFTLLIPHIHQGGGVGQQARDAMLLCMSLSRKNDEIGSYIADESNICPVLATGLSGLYSVLPRTLEIETEDWHRLTVDDVNDFPALVQLMNSLEFCNAVAQVAHPLVKKQLVEYLYKGFLVPVIGPALLQASIEELVAATAYFDLFLRSVTDPGLLYPVVKFLLEECYDGHPILDFLIKRIAYCSRLSIVTLALFETLVDLNCEDVMLKLCLGALAPCSHIMLSQRTKLRELDPQGAEKFLSLTPKCCLPSTPITLSASILMPNPLANVKTTRTPQPPPISESLYSNYYAYLRDARQKIAACQLSCLSWSCQYRDADEMKQINNNNKNGSTPNDDTEDISSKDTSDNVTSLSEESPVSQKKLEKSPISLLSPEEQAKLNFDIAELLAENVGSENSNDLISTYEKVLFHDEEPNTLNSLQLSIGDSSGYESFAFKGSNESTPENGDVDEEEEDDVNDTGKNHGEDVASKKPHEVIHHPLQQIKHNDILNEIIAEGAKFKAKKPNNPNEAFIEQPSVGPFLDELLKKLENMTENSVYVNLHLTGLISRLAIYPQPLLRSFLLNNSLVFQPSIRSSFQVLTSLKQKIDRFLSKQPDDVVESYVKQARIFLIERESKLINMRKNALESESTIIVPEKTALKDEPKRRSITSSITQMFKRTSSVTSNDSINHSYEEEMKIYSNNKKNSKYRVQNIVLCAVLIDEWLKELAAITQEHTIVNWLNDSKTEI